MYSYTSGLFSIISLDSLDGHLKGAQAPVESGTHSEFRESAPPPQSRLPVVLDVVCGHRRVGDPVVDDGVHAHCNRVPGEDLQEHHLSFITSSSSSYSLKYSPYFRLNTWTRGRQGRKLTLSRGSDKGDTMSDELPMSYKGA